MKDGSFIFWILSEVRVGRNRDWRGHLQLQITAILTVGEQNQSNRTLTRVVCTTYRHTAPSITRTDLRGMIYTAKNGIAYTE
jgi:hypothetical protein